MNLQNTRLFRSAGLADTRQHKAVAKDTERLPSIRFTTARASGDELATASGVEVQA